MSRARPDRPLAGRLAWLTLGLVLTGQFLDDALALARPFVAAEAPACDLLPPFGLPQEEKEERETTTLSLAALPARDEQRHDEGPDAPAHTPVPAPTTPGFLSPAWRPSLLIGAGVFRRC